MRAWAFAVAVSLYAGLSAAAADEPRLPCDGEPFPAYTALDAPPAVRVWTESGFVWNPPRCSGWGKSEYALLVAVASRFSHSGGVDGLVGRIARVSRFTGILYWSVSTQSWRRLVLDAHATAAPDRAARRDDFAPDELAPGPLLHFWQEERSPAGEMVYRLRVLERTPTRLIVDIRNGNPVDPPLHPKIQAGAYRFLHIFDKEEAGVWRYYGLMGLRGQGASAIEWFRASYVNRAVAVYRHLAGIPTDRDPPAAR